MNISSVVATSLSSGLLWPRFIGEWQHTRLPCTFYDGRYKAAELREHSVLGTTAPT